MDVKLDDLSGSKIAELLQAHWVGMAQHSPPESVHTLDFEKLRKPAITFRSAWEDTALLGCGAAQGSRFAELILIGKKH